MDINKLFTLIGELANVLAAICALVTICVTVNENKNLRKQASRIENNRFHSARFEALCLDRTIVLWDDLYKNLALSFDELKMEQNEDACKIFYDNMEEECKRFEVGIRFLKIYDKKLYKSVADQIEKIIDIVAECINSNSYKRGNLSRNQVSRYLARIGEQGYRIVEELHKYENTEIWRETDN